jgi:hypothetical protein
VGYWHKKFVGRGKECIVDKERGLDKRIEKMWIEGLYGKWKSRWYGVIYVGRVMQLFYTTRYPQRRNMFERDRHETFVCSFCICAASRVHSTWVKA